LQQNSASLISLRRWVLDPYRFGNLLGFKKLTPDHNRFIFIFLRDEYGRVRILQAHRGSYKTTCGLVAMTLLVMMFPNIRILISRKSKTMASKLIVALQQIFETPVMRMWFYARWGVTDITTAKWNTTELRLAINTRISPEPNFTAVGTGADRQEPEAQAHAEAARGSCSDGALYGRVAAARQRHHLPARVPQRQRRPR
jgi:hypothetical protein